MADFFAHDFDAIARALAQITLLAGPVVMEVYSQAADARQKSDGSPVTQADEQAEAILLAALHKIAPGLAVVAEESVAQGAALVAPPRFLLVDPLDGTREFIARNGEFTINIGLIENGAPIAGAVYAPALNQLWWGGHTAHSAQVPVGGEITHTQPLRVRPATTLTALASRSHNDPATEAFLTRLGVEDRLSAGSSLKFCALAQGRADVYPRFGPTMEWDTAAADAVLRAAGGTVAGLDGAPLRYGKLDQGLRHAGFIAWGDPALAPRIINAL